MDIPEDNAFTLSRWELGKKLFYETRMSIDNSISCASCHDPKLSFSDNNAFSPGVFDRPGTRNASMLANIGYAPNFLREGGIPTLEMQVLVPIQEHNEFNHNIIDIAEALNNDSVYQEMAMKAYESEVSAFVITRALGNFQRTLISGNSAYDHYVFLGKNNSLSTDAKKGMELFNSNRLNCSGCHSGVFFTNFDFANNGLKQMYADSGRMRLTGLESDRAVFKVPSLRNIEVTGPYLHDGSVETLMEVIERYSSGGFDHANKSELLQNPIELSDVEKNQLHAFLLSLTDHSFLYDERWQKDE
jgi:cytochrome c peroxidase